jgi:23S rRNA pseudouridine2605 synthase
MTDKDTEQNTPQRISKMISRAGLCSRRDAERWIAEGRVTLNGKVIDTPVINVTADDIITVDGKPIAIETEKTIRVWMMHKPVDLITTRHDPQGRETVFDLLPRKWGHVISVGRLDINSEGLLLLTNSGALSRYLELPRSKIPRTYQVRVYGRVDDTILEPLRRGITVDSVHYEPIDVEQYDPQTTASNQWLNVTLYEGKNREIRRVMTAIGLEVNRLVRVGYGPFALGDLPLGQTIEIAPEIVLQHCKNWGLV